MKNKKIIRKITQGMYILTTKNGGCVVDAVSQVSAGDFPLIAVSVMKKNYTHELMRQGGKFALSVLGMDVDARIIETFGFHSMKDVNKFDRVAYFKVDDVPVIRGSLGYMICEIVDSIENETHTLFIGRLNSADVLQEGEAMSYAYYQEHKDELLKVVTENGKTAWVCTICGYVYYGDILPDDFQCPVCGVDGSLFQKK